MSLQEEITKLKDQMMSVIPKDKLTVINRSMDELLKSNPTVNSLKKGEKIPSFALPNAKGNPLSSDDLLKQAPLVISFYRGGWCPYCSLELRALQHALHDIHQAGGQLVAISPELPDNSYSTSEKNSLIFEVLSDVGNKIAKKFGIVFSLAEDLRPVYKDLGIDLPSVNGDESYELPFPATYVVDKEGTILLANVDPDYTNRLDPSEIIELLQDIQQSND